MSIEAFRNKNGITVLVCIITLLLLYLVNPFKLSYQIQSWHQFGKLPITARQIQYFIVDTPNIVNFKDPERGRRVNCETTIAYLKTATDETYRCCDTGSRIACLAGDFSNELHLPEEECTNRLQEFFAVPAAPDRAIDFQSYESCGYVSGQTTIVQINQDGQILWKLVDVNQIATMRAALKCILVPLLLIIVIWRMVVIGQNRKNDNHRIPR